MTVPNLQHSPEKNKSIDTVPLWIMGTIVVLVILIVLYGTQS